MICSCGCEARNMGYWPADHSFTRMVNRWHCWACNKYFDERMDHLELEQFTDKDGNIVYQTEPK